MKNFFKRLFGKKKNTEEVPLLTKDEEQPISVPSEIKFIDEAIDKKEDLLKQSAEKAIWGEPIAPTLERWDDDYIEKRKAAYEFNKRAIEDLKEGNADTYFSIEKLNEVYKKLPKPKKQAKKKDNRNPDDDKSSWPKGNNFSL